MGADNSGVIYALWNYLAQAADELSFREGDMVTVLQRPDGVDWWWASLCGREGSLPVPVYGNVSTLTDRSAAAAQREPIEEQDNLHYATIYTSCSENQVQSDQKEQMTDPSQPNNEGITVLHNALCGAMAGVEEAMGADNSGVIYALWNYPAQAADELSFREGDMVTVLQRPDGVDWWWASLCGREGFLGLLLVVEVDPVDTQHHHHPRATMHITITTVAALGTS
ncbi:hypothetical protein NHX12_009239, partial [Muraenolepis orangiensis]